MFTIYSNSSDCPGRLNNINEVGDDMELSIRFLSDPSEWIPLALIQINSQIVDATRHGYVIPYILELHSRNMPICFGNVTICNFSLNDSFQLRWLLTSHAVRAKPRDVWSLDDIEIVFIADVNNSATLLEDSFDMEYLK